MSNPSDLCARPGCGHQRDRHKNLKMDGRSRCSICGCGSFVEPEAVSEERTPEPFKEARERINADPDRRAAIKREKALIQTELDAPQVEQDTTIGDSDAEVGLRGESERSGQDRAGDDGVSRRPVPRPVQRDDSLHGRGVHGPDHSPDDRSNRPTESDAPQVAALPRGDERPEEEDTPLQIAAWGVVGRMAEHDINCGLPNQVEMDPGCTCGNERAETELFDRIAETEDSLQAANQKVEALEKENFAAAFNRPWKEVAEVERQAREAAQAEHRQALTSLALIGRTRRDFPHNSAEDCLANIESIVRSTLSPDSDDASS